MDGYKFPQGVLICKQVKTSKNKPDSNTSKKETKH